MNHQQIKLKIKMNYQPQLGGLLVKKLINLQTSKDIRHILKNLALSEAK